MDDYSPLGTEELLGEARSNQFNDIEAYEKRVKSFQDKANSALSKVEMLVNESSALRMNEDA